mmetsp:Transcript_172132/g.418576  ORF Transcript_172132/g.418576 Transcript_172132/m.418576 type:complete len:297 (+) Transcript_172132:57-947(+)
MINHNTRYRYYGIDQCFLHAAAPSSRLLFRGQHLSDALAKPDAVPCALAKPRHDDLVPVGQKLARLAVAQVDGLRPRAVALSRPGQLEHRPEARRIDSVARDRAGPEQIAGAHVAPRHSVVHQLLAVVPVHVPPVRPREGHRLRIGSRPGRAQRHGQLEVVRAVVGVAQVRVRHGICLLPRARRTVEGSQRGRRDDPGRDRRHDVFGRERAQRDVLPLLNVAGAPVVEQHKPEHVLVGLGDVDDVAQLVAGSHERAHLELKVEQLAGPERRPFLRVGPVLLQLTLWAHDRRARQDD